MRFAISVVFLVSLATACAKGGDAAPAAGAGAGNVDPAPVDIKTRLATADPSRGKTLFLQCRACHGLEAGGPNKVGPNLHGVFGRKAGVSPGFAYSEAIAQSNIVWSVEAVDQFLTRPSDFLPGNHMVFVGIRNPDDRASLIAYLRQEAGAK